MNSSFKKMAISASIISLLGMPSIVSAGAYGLNVEYRNGTDTGNATSTVDPADLADGSISLLGFRGLSGGDSMYQSIILGSGIGKSGNIVFATPNTIETTEGFLVDTLTALKSNLAIATSSLGSMNASISSLNSSVSNNVIAIFTQANAVSAIGTTTSVINANIYGTSTTMRVGYGTSTVAGFLEVSRWNAMTSAMAAATSTIASIQSTLSGISIPGLASATSSGLLSSSLWSKLSDFAWSDITGKPSFATVATSGSYADLTSKPALGISYEGTTQRTSSFPIFKSATVSSGTAVVHLTADGTSGGTALCTNGVIQDSVNPTVSDASASYQMQWAFTNSNKTLTVTANKLTTSNILTGILGQAQANGSVVKVTVWCY